MAKIVNIESATTNCSVSVAVDGEVVLLKEENADNYKHSEQLHVFIEEAVKESGLTFSELDAIAVSKGPGSYTGLRIGVSGAKGLCFALQIPLISVPTLQNMAHQLQVEENAVIIPVLDARRMEVYSCVFNHNYLKTRATKAEVIDENSFSEYASNKVYLIGDGAKKCEETLQGEHLNFDASIYPSAKEMATISFQKYQQKDFEDVAYFEPYYLKDFVLQKPKK